MGKGFDGKNKKRKMIKFVLPDHLTSFDYEKLLKETEILKDVHYSKPITYLELLHTKLDATKINVPVLTSGNLSAIQGKAKSRKTFFIIIAAQMIYMQKNISIAFFDTEQFNFHSALTLWRINKLIPENKLRFFNLRKYSIDVRLEFVENYILHEKPDLIFLDNIRDCMIDINNWSETNKIITTFVQLSDEFKTHICLTLHENPGADNDKARGAIGTELQNKCETIFRLEKDKNDPRYTTVKGLFTRNMEFDSLVFHINEDGFPVLISDFEGKKNIDNEVGPF
jgi:hypothetical protein